MNDVARADGPYGERPSAGASACDWTLERTIPSDPTASRGIVDELLAQLRARCWAEGDVFGVHLSLEEAMMNAIKHGNRYAVDKSVHVSCRLGSDAVHIQITDEGPGFNPLEVRDCTDEEGLEFASGRGVMLIRSFMSSVAWSDRGNRVTMVKSRAAAS